MWLINVESMKLEEFTLPHLPTYAALSRTWANGEAMFHEFKSPYLKRRKPGIDKMRETRRLAAVKRIPYVWVDTCCIDKSSSAELSEAINSMFEWYKLSAVCFAYLSDLPKESPTLWRNEESQLVCRWFQRGWTLQELLAPAKLEFFDSCQAAVGEKMSWASKRETKRVEDLAYCLLGIFQVNMPMLYGEGMRAFQRLQEEIMKSSTDMSLFCWKTKPGESDYSRLLVRAPAEFESYNETARNSGVPSSFAAPTQHNEFSVTNKGVRIDAEFSPTDCIGVNWERAFMIYNLSPYNHAVLVLIRYYRDNTFVRELPDLILPSTSSLYGGRDKKLIYIPKDVDDQVNDDLAARADPSLSFIVSPLPASFRLKLVGGWPQELWSRNHGSLDCADDWTHTFIVDYELINGDVSVVRIAAMCRRDRSAVKFLRHALAEMNKDLDEGMQKSILGNNSVEGLVAARRQRVEIYSCGTKLEFPISKFLPNNEKRVNTLYINSLAEAAFLG